MDFHRPELTANDVELLHQEVMYEGYLRLLRYQLRYRLFAGGWTPIVTRELLASRPAVGVLLFDPLRDEIVLVEQFRVSAWQANHPPSPWLLEIVAGVVESGESMEKVAEREAQEEAGLSVLDLIPMCQYLTNPGVSTGKFVLFCGRVDTRHAGGIFGLAHEQEDIKAHVFPTALVYQALQEGWINNAPTIIALQWLQLHENTVKRRWQI